MFKSGREEGMTPILTSSYEDQCLSAIKLKQVSTTYYQGATDKLPKHGGDQLERYLSTEDVYKSRGLKDIHLQGLVGEKEKTAVSWGLLWDERKSVVKIGERV